MTTGAPKPPVRVLRPPVGRSWYIHGVFGLGILKTTQTPGRRGEGLAMHGVAVAQVRVRQPSVPSDPPEVDGIGSGKSIWL